MKNKKSIAMAMAAVSTFGAVAPAFANGVQTLAFDEKKIDVMLASGYALNTIKVDEKDVVKVYNRTEIYNTNGTKDRSDDTLKAACKDAKIVLSQENKADSYSDEFVLATKVIDVASVNEAKSYIETAKTLIAEAKEKGAKVVVKNEAAKIVDGEFKDSKVTVEITNKGSQSVNATYVFVGAEGIVDDKEEVIVTGETLYNDIFKTAGFEKAETLNLSDDTKYYEINLIKSLIEANIDKFDIFKEESGQLNADLDVTLYVKGSDQTKKENEVIKIKFQNFTKVNKDLLVTLPNIENSDFSNHWAKEQIVEAMLKKQIDASSTFRPGDSITRAEFVKIVNRIFNVDTTIVDKSLNTEFDDVEAGSWYYSEVKAAARAGYINGYETSKTVTDVSGETIVEVVREFKPNQPITRQEAAKIIATMVNGSEVETDADINTGFADDKAIASWADESVKYLKDKNITNGYEENGKTVFKPQANITRAEAVVMLLRAGKVEK